MLMVADTARDALKKVLELEEHSGANLIIYFQGFG